MEETKVKRTCLERTVCSSKAKEDLISQLPDSLITQILFYLQTKKAVTTSVLSKRWRSLWLSTPGLVLISNDFTDYNAFVSFVDKFLGFSREQKLCLHKLKLSIRKGENDQDCVTRWIDFVATPKLKHLDVEIGPTRCECFEVIPLSLYSCESLLYLRLNHVCLGKFESVSLPCLKTMSLEQNIYANEADLESLISSCPVLEDLSFGCGAYDKVNVLRVQSQTLTSLNIEGCVEYLDLDKSEVLIDAPRLKYLNLETDQYESKTIRNSGSLTKVNLLGYFHMKNNDDDDEVDLQKRDMVHNFFTSISGVSDMKISSQAFAGLRYWTLKKELRLSFVPRCLLSSLEFVEIKGCSRSNMERVKQISQKSPVTLRVIKSSGATFSGDESTSLKLKQAMSDRGGGVVRGRSRTGEDRINFRRYHKFVSFMTSFLDYSKDLCIHILKLSFEINHRDPSYMTRCQTLVSLKLRNVSLPDFEYVDIDVYFDIFDNHSAGNVSSKKIAVRKLLTGLSSVRDMTISGKTWEVICLYLNQELLPQFPHMTRLCVNSYEYYLKMFPMLLKSCPNLKSLFLIYMQELMEYKNEQTMLSLPVPECLRPSLEYIKMKRPRNRAGAEMILANYFLENEVVLKKFTLRLCCGKVEEESVIFMELLKFRKCSASCEVVVQRIETYPTMIHRFL
ncbi:FBD domain [Arabidopsis suecica]|uniref:FBD domain n=1 Tax=Arabidopsis suecica TaxID=45249 RepID=A0A8T2DET2_ARASU|nr:FBD domain [Arabidopsis suecica]